MLSVESRSFVNGVNDQVQKRQKRISNVSNNGETFHDLGSVHDCNHGIKNIHGKFFQNNPSIVNTADLTLKHMFDICEISDRTR